MIKTEIVLERDEMLRLLCDLARRLRWFPDDALCSLNFAYCSGGMDIAVHMIDGADEQASDPDGPGPPPDPSMN